MVKLDLSVPCTIDVWPYSHTSMEAGKQLDYYGTDSVELFERNKKQKREWIYNTKPVTYNFNSNGLRMKELDKVADNYILFSGASVAMGIGVSQEDRYSDLISNQSNLDFINYAGPTYTIRMQTISFMNLLKSNFKLPKVLVVEYPPCEAYTYYTNNQYIFCYNKHMPTESNEYTTAYKHLSTTDFFLNEASIHRNMLIGICKRLGIKFIELSFHKDDQFIINSEISCIDINSNNTDINYCYARDLRLQNGALTAHPGIGIHREVTDKILSIL
jgi:hypothetical protein